MTTKQASPSVTLRPVPVIDIIGADCDGGGGTMLHHYGVGVFDDTGAMIGIGPVHGSMPVVAAECRRIMEACCAK